MLKASEILAHAAYLDTRKKSDLRRDAEALADNPFFNALLAKMEMECLDMMRFGDEDNIAEARVMLGVIEDIRHQIARYAEQKERKTEMA